MITHPDILIIGGGAAGVAAAAGASAMGAQVVLAEQNSYLGGKATAAYVGTVCGLFYTSQNPLAEFVVGGFPKAFGEKLMDMSKSELVFQKGGLHFFSYKRSAFMELCYQYAIENCSQLMLNAKVVDLSISENKIQQVTIETNNSSINLYPKAVVDTTGESLVTEFTEIEHIKSDEYQAAAHVFSVKGITASDHTALHLGIVRSILKGIEAGLLPKNYERLSVVPGSFKNEEAVLKLGIPLAVTNDPSRISEIETFALKAIADIFNYLQLHNQNFKHSEVTFIAPETGIRTGPRNMGEYVLTENDVLNCHKHIHSVARGSWPVEYWKPGKNVELTFFNSNDFYDIPPGALISKYLNNLFFAGRNISASDKAIASARVIGTCLQTGFAAGMLAGGHILNHDRVITVKAIQKAMFH